MRAHLVGIAHAHFMNARIVVARGLVGTLHQVNLGQHIGFVRRQRHGIKIVRRLVGQADDRLLGRAAGNQRRGTRGVQNALLRQIVGVGITSAFTRQHANAAADRNALGGRLHHALVERNRGGSLIFKVEVGEIAASRKRRRQVPLNISLHQPIANEEKLLIHSHTYWMPNDAQRRRDCYRLPFSQGIENAGIRSHIPDGSIITQCCAS